MILFRNALIRVEGKVAPACPPFDKPHDSHDFWVLEIPLQKNAGILEFCDAAKAAFRGTMSELLKLCSEGAVATLFCELESFKGCPLVLDAELISLLGQLGAKIELFEAE